MTNFLLAFGLLFIFTPLVCAQTEGELYEKVFGSQKLETRLEFFVKDRSLGDIDVQVSAGKLFAVDRKVLNLKLKAIIKKNYFKVLKSSSKWFDIDHSPYLITYDANKLKVLIDIPEKELLPIFYSLDANPRLKYLGETIKPAPIAGSFNYIIDKNFGDEVLGGDSFSTYFNSFLNINNYVLNVDGFYEESFSTRSDSKWSRRDTNITKDFIDLRLRSQIGDTITGRFGFMQSRLIGGLNVRKQFSIDPYNLPFSQGEKEFQIIRRSKVKTFVNGTMVKSEVLSAGNYRLTNLPLINGINNVRVEIDDDVNTKQILEFNIPISTSILRPGEVNYSISTGSKIDDSGSSRTYDSSNYTSGFLQYGFSKNISAGFYQELDKDFILSGIESGLSTTYGNVFWGTAFSNNSLIGDKGLANSLTWQYQSIAGLPFDGFSLVLRYENFINEFKSSREDSSRYIKNTYSSNFSFPLFQNASFNLGAGINDYIDSSFGNRSYIRSTFNYRASNNLNISFYASRVKDGINGQDNTLSAFLTWNFDNSNHYVSTFRDFESKNSRVALTKDNNNELYNPRYTVAYNEDRDNKRLNATSQVPTPMADVFFRGSYSKSDSGVSSNQVGFGLSSSMLFAYDNELSFAFARSNQSSFALFKPSDNLKNQKVSIKSTSTYADAESPFIGDIALTNLVSYQYREVQADPTKLDYGTSLEKEKFVLLPAFKTGHIIKINDNGTRSIQGILKKEGKALALKVCELGNKLFFTDRSGYFYIEGVDSEKNILKISGKKVKTITIKSNKTGVVDIGIINLD